MEASQGASPLGRMVIEKNERRTLETMWLVVALMVMVMTMVMMIVMILLLIMKIRFTSRAQTYVRYNMTNFSMHASQQTSPSKIIRMMISIKRLPHCCLTHFLHELDDSMTQQSHTSSLLKSIYRTVNVIFLMIEPAQEEPTLVPGSYWIHQYSHRFYLLLAECTHSLYLTLPEYLQHWCLTLIKFKATIELMILIVIMVMMMVIAMMMVLLMLMMLIKGSKSTRHSLTRVWHMTIDICGGPLAIVFLLIWVVMMIVMLRIAKLITLMVFMVEVMMPMAGIRTHDERLQYLKAKHRVGGTPLHWAAQFCHSDTVKVLLESVAQDERLEYLKAKDEGGSTALHWAAEFGQSNTVKVLVESVAQDERLEYLKAKDEGGSTALHWAANDIDIIKYFLESVEPLQRSDLLSDSNQYEDTVLLLMAKNSNSECICQVLKMLTLTQRFDCLKIQGKYGETVLHNLSAIRQKDHQSKLAAILSLTGRFAPPLLLIKNKDGKTPMDVAAEASTKELLTQKLATYNLNKPPHVIIFYTTYERSGAVEEMQTLSDVFTSTGLPSEICCVFNKDTLLRKINYACSQRDISGMIVVIMTHGDASSVRDQHQQPVDIQDIILALGGGDGIPKVLILQACRGRAIMPNTTFELCPHNQQPGLGISATPTTYVSETSVAQSSSADASRSISGSGTSDASVASKRLETFHLMKGDVLVVCATLHECVAIRNHFIPMLAKHIDQATLSEDFYTIFKKTYIDMRDQLPETDQVPEFRSTMSRSFCIKDFAHAQ